MSLQTILVVRFWATVIAVATVGVAGGAGIVRRVLRMFVTTPGSLLLDVPPVAWIADGFRPASDAVVVALREHGWALRLLIAVLVFLPLFAFRRPGRSTDEGAGLRDAWLAAFLTALLAVPVASLWCGLKALEGWQSWDRWEEDAPASRDHFINAMLPIDDTGGRLTARLLLKLEWAAAASRPGQPAGAEDIATALRSWDAIDGEVDQLVAGVSDASRREALSLGLRIRAAAGHAAPLRGGRPGSPKRRLTFRGPGGRMIDVRTSFLAPDHRLSWGAPAGRREKAWADWRSLNDGSSDALALDPAERASVDALQAAAAGLDPEDVLVHLGTTVIIEHAAWRRLLAVELGRDVEARPSTRRDLLISLYNSEVEYNQETHATGRDLVGAGRYLYLPNEVVAWLDERALSRQVARDIVKNSFSIEVGGDVSRPPVESLPRGLRAGFLILDHELAHWALQLHLDAEKASKAPPLPRCLDEGLVLRFQEGNRAASGVVRDWREIARRDQTPSAKAAPLATLHDARALDEGSSEDQERAYARCFALADRFGPALLRSWIEAPALPDGQFEREADRRWRAILGEVSEGAAPGQ